MTAGTSHVLPLSFAQQRLWFLDQLMPGSAAYNITEAVAFPRGVRVDVLERSLNEIARRHEVLRTRFATIHGEPFQVIAPAITLKVAVEDLSGCAQAEREAESARVASAEAARPFDLSQGPLLRARLVRLGARKSVLLLTMHHIISDGWSIDVLLRELSTLYQAFVAGRPSPLPELTLQYADFAVWQRDWLQGDVLETQLAYWRERLRGMPPLLELPADRPRPPVQSFRGACESLAVPPAVARRLVALAEQQRVTLFMLLLAAFKALLARYTRQDDLVVGSPIANRTHIETEPLIGLFVNTLILRTDVSGDPTFVELVQRVREVCLGAYAHQDLPFEKLVAELHPERTLDHNPLVQVLFQVQHADAARDDDGQGARTVMADNVSEVDTAVTKFDLSVTLEAGDGGMIATFEYSTDLFEQATIARMARHFGTLLEALAGNPHQRLSHLPLLSAEEKQRLLVARNQTDAQCDSGRCLHELVEAQVRRNGSAPAVVAIDGRLTYDELNRRANQLARHLRRLGVGAEERVGVYVERGRDMIVALLGVLKAGGAYVPLDPTYPADRLGYTLSHAQVRVLLTQARLVSQLPPHACAVVALDEQWDEIALESPDDLPTIVVPENLAYVIYTSGSTGRPKGVAICHRSAVVFVSWALDVFTREELAGVLASTSICFDLSVFEIFVPLACGGSVHVAEHALQLSTLPTAASITLINTVPTAIRELVRMDGVPASVRVINLAGEALVASLVREIYRNTRIQRLFNLYGPTEATTYATGALIRREDEGPVPIGKPISHTQVYVVDERMQPTPEGVPGQLYIGGASLARGYLNSPNLTADAFIANPFGDGGDRIYRTGDLVRYLADGNLEYLGRLDHQVKVRGFRIELGEIEAALEQHGGVRDSIVVAREDGAENDGAGKRLVAYVVPAAGSPEAPAPSWDALPRDLRNHLKQRLPEFMVPSAIVLLDELPLTPNGKIDRRALPVPEAVRPELGPVFAPPCGEIEQELARIWCRVLGLERVGREDNFFDLGGHSLLATRVISRVREALRVQLPLRSLFENPTIAGLAGFLAEQQTGPPSTPAIGRRHHNAGPVPLSFAQQRLWFLDQLMPGTPAYNITEAVEFPHGVQVDVLERSLDEIARRHDVLRTRFAAVHGEPFQVIAPAIALKVAVDDLRGRPDAERELAHLASDEAARPFDLSQGPLLRARVVHFGANQSLLLLTMHHIISDGWSTDVLLRELAILYEAFATGQPSPLPELPLQYADFAVWQREWVQGDVLDTQLAYWRERLHGMPPLLELPADRPRPPVQSFRGSCEWLGIPPATARGLLALCEQQRVTLFMLLLSAFKALLARYTHQHDLVVGSPIANRTHIETEPLIGLFVNTLILRTDVAGDPTFLELLQRVREVCLGAYAHQDLPFEKLVAELHPERNLDHNPLVQILFQVEHAPQHAPEEPRLSYADRGGTPLTSNASELDVTFIVEVNGDELTSSVEYNTDLYTPVTMKRFLQEFNAILERIVADPTQRLSPLALWTEEDYQRSVIAWNRTELDHGCDPCLHELVEAQAARLGAAAAVTYDGQTLTYAALNERSNRVAHYLRTLGVGPNVPVAVCMQRSVDIIVGIMGILKAGGAYVPLDPEYPAQRLAFMIEDVRPPVLLTESALLSNLPGISIATVCLDRDAAIIGRHSGANPPRATSPADLAYVIYTSGSSGRPKGVTIPHRAICNRVLWEKHAFPLTEADAVLQRASFSFDASVWEIFAPLTMGARLVMARSDSHYDAAYLVDLIERERVTAISMIPSLLELLMSAGLERCRDLKHVFCGVEVMTHDLEQRFLATQTAALHNLYGPTEACIDATIWTCRPNCTHPQVPIGRPLANTEVYLLDADLKPVPLGVPGELCIGGVGLSHGYLNRAGLTAEKFIPHPFATRPGARLYRTGDLASYLPDGAIQYLGRLDHQVKVRGFRIELGEIEAALAQHSGVRESIVVAREDGADKRLVAYVVPVASALDAREASWDALHSALRQHLKQRLPDYMIPSAMVVLDELPRMPNGKVDRRALPAPDSAGPAPGSSFTAPCGDIEQELARIWCKVLGVKQVGREDNFFDLGGHSLLATRVMSRVREALRIQLPLRSLFENPTIASLAVAVRSETRSKDSRRLVTLKRLPRGRPQVMGSRSGAQSAYE